MNPIFESSISLVKQKIQDSNSIVILSHRNPDGDAIGSSLALYNYLLVLNKKVTVVLPNDYPAHFGYLEGSTNIVITTADKPLASSIIQSADLIFCLDFNHPDRVGDNTASLLASSGYKIMIDHHLEPFDFCDLVFSYTKASSTCELVYEFVEALGDIQRLPLASATAIYTGIITDTGSFRHSSTTPKTHAIASQLLAIGVAPSIVQHSIFGNNSADKLQLLGYCLNQKLVVIPELKLAYFTLKRAERNQFNYQEGDLEGIVNYGLSIAGVEFSVFISETPENVKMSFRSVGNYTVNDLARDNFNGGGHANAAGGTSNLSLEKTIAKLLDIMPLHLQKKEITN